MSENPPFPMRHARIGYKNIATQDNVTASTEAEGWLGEDAVTPLTFEGWRPTALPATLTVDAGAAVPADYFGLVASLSGCTAYLERSADNVSWTTVVAVAPTNDAALMRFFDEVSARYWRLRITGGAVMPLVRVFFVGVALQMQRPIYSGHTPLTLARQTEYANSVSEGGQFLGRSIVRKGVGTAYAWANLTAAWYRQYFDPFVSYAQRGAFFIAWNPLQFPDEVGFIWVPEDIKPSNSGPRDLMSVSFNAGGIDGR